MRAAGTVVIVPVLALAACTGAPVAAMSRAKPPVSATPQTMPPAPPTALQVWCSGNGYDAWSSVGADVAQVHADAGDGDVGDLAAAGGQLSADALATGDSLPPFGQQHRFDYGTGMLWLAVAGRKLVTGDIGGASAAMRTANGYLNGDGINALINRDCLGV